MQHPFRGMNELTTDSGCRHSKGGDVGLVICVEFISQSNLKPACSKKPAKISYLCHAPYTKRQGSLSLVTAFFSADSFRAESVCTCATYCHATADVQMWPLHQEVIGLSLW